MSIVKVIRFFPGQDRIVVKQDNAETKTAGGIIIPDTAKEKDQRGIVIAVGPLVEKGACEVGDHIQYAKYAGQEVKYDGKNEYILIRENDLSGVIREYEIDDEVIDPITLKPYATKKHKK